MPLTSTELASLNAQVQSLMEALTGCVEKPWTPKFKVGDRVRLITGEIGVVKDVDVYKKFTLYRLRTGTEFEDSSAELEPLPSPEKKQFTVRLNVIGGQMGNYFAHGGFERQLETARLVCKLDETENHVTLLFDPLHHD